jgi:hypothetical protein
MQEQSIKHIGFGCTNRQDNLIGRGAGDVEPGATHLVGLRLKCPSGAVGERESACWTNSCFWMNARKITIICTDDLKLKSAFFSNLSASSALWDVYT